MSMQICTCGAVVPGRCCPHCGACLGRESKPRRAASAAVLALGLAACGGGFVVGPEPAYGVPLMDEDLDGYESDVDCDDTDDTIYPGAEETAGDGVDSNCDGEDDPQS